MTRFVRVTIAALPVLLVLGACKKSSDASPASRQVELAPAATAQPQLGDTAQSAPPSPTADIDAAKPATPAAAPAAAPKPPRATASQPSAAPSNSAALASAAPAKAPAPVAPTTGVIAGGTALGVAMGSRVCTNTHRVGDRVTASLSVAASGTNGLYIPAGSNVTLRVTESARGENGKEGIRLAFEPVSVVFGGDTYDITGAVAAPNIETVRAQSTGDQVKKVAVGAAVGALAGQLLGKKTKSTVIGAAVGAAAGGAVAVGTADWNGCVPVGGRLTVTLSGPVTVKLAP